jgi:hypothetical protein
MTETTLRQQEMGASITMSVLTREDELLVEWNDAARLSLPKYLLIFLQNKQKTTQTHGMD